MPLTQRHFSPRFAGVVLRSLGRRISTIVAVVAKIFSANMSTNGTPSLYLYSLLILQANIVLYGYS